MRLKCLAAPFAALAFLACPCAFAAEFATQTASGHWEEITDAATAGYDVGAFQMSSDATTVIFQTYDAAAEEEHVRLINTDGTGETVLATYPAGGYVVNGLVISADADKAAWIVNDPSDKYTIYLYSAGEGVTELVTQAQHSAWGESSLVDIDLRGGLSMSGDGGLVVFLCTFGPQGPNHEGIPASGLTFWGVNTAGGAAFPIIESRHLQDIPGISPNASRLWDPAELNHDGTVMTCTPVGPWQDYRHKNVLILNPLGGKGAASVLLDTDGMYYEGGALSGDGSLFIFVRYGDEAPEPHGLQIVPTDLSEAPLFLHEGLPQSARHPRWPQLSRDGLLATFEFDVGGGSSPTIRTIPTVLSGKVKRRVIPLSDDYLIDTYSGVSQISDDGLTVAMRGAIRHTSGSAPGNIIIFRWPRTKQGGVPAVTSLECDPSDELLRQTGGVSPKAPTHFHYATSGSNRGRFAQIGYDDTGILPAGVNGFAYGFISDNGSAPDEAADDGRYADGWVWIRDEFTGDAFYARGIISSTDRTAAFSEYRIDVRDPDPAHASFVADVTSGAAPLTVTFTDQSNGDVSTRNWDFDGDGYVDAANPDEPVEYTYASSGVYSVSLEVSGPLAGSDAMTRTDYIEVFQSVQADFTADPTSGEAPLTVTFTDLSTGDITNREWDFDGDGVADAANPSAPIEYTYAEPGVYDVTLTVTGPPGTDYETKAEYVEVIRKTGDVNGDNAINAIDIQLVILGIFKLDTGGHDPDVNGDGQVNAVDVQMTILALFGLL